MKRTALVLSLLSLTPALLPAQVSVPLFMSYQGRVTDAAGVGIGTGVPVNRKVIFRLYSSSTDTAALWTEEQTVTISDGEFSVLLGLGIQPITGLYANAAHPPLNAAFAKSGTDRYLGITVDGGDGTINASDTELTPRQRLATTAYALRAASADSVATGTDLQLNGGSNYGLGWYGTDRTFNGVAVDGPVLYGQGGGALGVVNGATQTSVLRWDANGKVGIGTGAANLSTLTNTKLVIQGDDTTAPAQQLSIRGNADPNKRLNLGFNTTSNLGAIQSWSAASVAGSLLLNPSGGNVGINTTTAPTVALDVNGSMKASALTLSGALSAGSISATGQVSTTGTLQSSSAVLASGSEGFRFLSGDGDGGMFSPQDNVVQFKTNDIERMRLNSAGALVSGNLTTKAADGKYSILNMDSLNSYAANGTGGTLYLNYAGGTVQVGQGGVTNFGVNGTVYANGAITSTGRIYAAGTNGGGFAFSGPGDSDGGMFSTADGIIVFRTDNVDRVWVRQNGRVGIGTAEPLAMLDVNGSIKYTNTANGAYWNFSPPSSNAFSVAGAPNEQDYSIRASNWVLAKGYWCVSDERLKEKLGYSDSSTDLETMMKLKIADYRFKDTVQNGTAEQKKVIAQDVEKVYPQAVTCSKGIIPDIFKKVPVDKDGWITLNAGLKKGDQVRLIGKDGATSQHEVLEATDDKFRTGYKTEDAEVFVYGRQVDDLRTVDYEALAMLNISATQEIVRKLQSKSDELTALNARLAALEAKDKERDDKLALLEKLVLATRDGNAGKDGNNGQTPAPARTVALQQQAKAAE